MALFLTYQTRWTNVIVTVPVLESTPFEAVYWKVCVINGTPGDGTAVGVKMKCPAASIVTDAPAGTDAGTTAAVRGSAGTLGSLSFVRTVPATETYGLVPAIPTPSCVFPTVCHPSATTVGGWMIFSVIAAELPEQPVGVSMAVTPTEKIPPTEGVPVMAPVVELIESPVGSPVALQAVVPTTPVCEKTTVGVTP